MKVDILANGILSVTSETEVESFALRQWMALNINSKRNVEDCLWQFDATFGAEDINPD